MATITKVLPSASTNGQPVQVAATATPGTLWHTAVAGAAAFDEIYLFLANIDTVQHVVTVEFGAATAPYNVVVIVPAQDQVLVIAGVPLNGADTVKVFADLTNKVNAYGYINRIA